MKTTVYFFAAGLLAACSASAVSLDMVHVYDVGNPADPLNSGSVPGIGSVNYEYNIGTYEVTNAQYAEFLNSVAKTSDTHSLYNGSMSSSRLGGITQSGTAGNYTYIVKRGFANKPVNYVSFWDAARFTNWLTNGQLTGRQSEFTTETGVYMLTADGIANNTITRDATAWANGGFAIASENEWYKAAYYQPAYAGGDSDNYWLYPTRSNSITTTDANYGSSNLTNVGNYNENASYYRTFDQGGNVFEWNDEILFIGRHRGLRGGSFGGGGDFYLQSSNRYFLNPAGEFDNIGFRVSSQAAVPEPSTYAAVFGGLGLLIVLLRRKGRRTL